MEMVKQDNRRQLSARVHVKHILHIIVYHHLQFGTEAWLLVVLRIYLTVVLSHVTLKEACACVFGVEMQFSLSDYIHT